MGALAVAYVLNFQKSVSAGHVVYQLNRNVTGACYLLVGAGLTFTMLKFIRQIRDAGPFSNVLHNMRLIYGATAIAFIYTTLLMFLSNKIVETGSLALYIGLLDT
jgi:heme/copper-type cytochrome/quinol oxidase subunit 2